MNTNRIKLIAVIFFALPLLMLATFKVTPVTTAAKSVDEPAVVYKAKCAACHTPGATKFYDLAKPDAEHVQIILKGKKGEKPPYMPGFAEKGMTEVDATALAVYMRGLRTAN